MVAEHSVCGARKQRRRIHLFELFDPSTRIHSIGHLAVEVIAQHQERVRADTVVRSPSLHRISDGELLPGLGHGAPVAKHQDVVRLWVWRGCRDWLFCQSQRRTEQREGRELRSLEEELSSAPLSPSTRLHPVIHSGSLAAPCFSAFAIGTLSRSLRASTDHRLF